ncbi:hypothetical protein ACFQY4_23020 [Catellatospora bangladeshensis]|uniref:hypothetical protein n=1 Tax=Catellatospora bangladeshensis TaxID=310355 RepID=UPI00361B94C8
MLLVAGLAGLVDRVGSRCRFGRLQVGLGRDGQFRGELGEGAGELADLAGQLVDAGAQGGGLGHGRVALHGEHGDVGLALLGEGLGGGAAGLGRGQGGLRG